MTISLDYYFAPQSPWTYLGHQRLAEVAKAVDAQIRVRPVDLAKVFPVFGGVQLKDRHPQRQAYRLVELARFRDELNQPLNLEPKYFPVVPTMASKLIIAIQQGQDEQAAFKLSGALMTAVWAQERNIADENTLATLLSECGLPASALADAQSPSVQAFYEQYTDAAIEIGVFGAPSYVLDGEVFWGQDRLNFLEKALQARWAKTPSL